MEPEGVEETPTADEEKERLIKYGGKTVVIIAVIILAAVGLYYLLLGTGIDIFDLFGGKPAEMLIIGNSSQKVIDVLNQNETLVRYTIKTLDSLERNPAEQIKDYDIILLDQSEEVNKEVSLELGMAIEEYVKSGGKLIIVKDSGIRRPGAADVVGWQSTFGNIMPVECELKGPMNLPSCSQAIVVSGKLKRLDEDHTIMNGIEVVPAEPGSTLVFTVFDVNPTGNQIAYIEDTTNEKSYPAIVEKKSLLGTTIYFNYNPGKTRGILEATLRYLVGK